jgi:hypothetical protein
MEQVTSTSTPATTQTPTTSSKDTLLEKIGKMGEEELNTLIKEIEYLLEKIKTKL